MKTAPKFKAGDVVVLIEERSKDFTVGTIATVVENGSYTPFITSSSGARTACAESRLELAYIRNSPLYKELA